MLPVIAALVLDSGPCPALPLARGTSWTYRAEVAWTVSGSDSARRQTVEWTTTVLDVERSDSAIAATVQGWPTDLAWWEPGRQPTISIMYCDGDRVYQLRPPPHDAPARRAALVEGSQHPEPDDLILELPLRSGGLFGRDRAARPDTFYAWLVESVGPMPPAIRALRPGLTDSLYTLVYRTNPDQTTVDFVPGLGVARYRYSHHGTTSEVDARLVDFHEGTP